MTTETQPGTFTAQERSAMKARAAELRTEGKKGERKADDLQAALAKIAEMAPADRVLAERVHATTVPEVLTKTWYGMSAYTTSDGKLLVAFKNAGKFGTRYCTLEFQEASALDDGDMWPVSFAITTWSPAVEARVAGLIATAAARG